MPSPLDYLAACPPCGWCCRGERVYLSADEARILGIGDKATALGQQVSGACELLDAATGYCRAHSLRPTECRLFPLDIIRVNGGEPEWVLWDEPCPVGRASLHGSATRADAIAKWELEMQRWEALLTPEWVAGYLEHHAEQPAKYWHRGYLPLRGVARTRT